jgi:hypothetical protein
MNDSKEHTRRRDVARCLEALGYDYRMDWSSFDGRCLRDQLDELAAALNGLSSPFDPDEWIACNTTYQDTSMSAAS